MFAPHADKVLDMDLDALLGPGGTSRVQVEEQVVAAMRRHGLRVHLVVLCHGHDGARFETTARLCRALEGLRHAPGVDLAVSYQGGPAPAGLTALLDTGVPVLAGHPLLVEAVSGAPMSGSGKTEHLLSCLASLLEAGGDPERRFVVFLDNDYLVYDPENVFALYAPWALGFATGEVPCADERFAGVSFAKGGSLRLAVAPEMAKPAGERTWGFADLLEAALAHCVPRAPTVGERLPAGFVPTRDALLQTLGPAQFAELEAAVEQITKSGGRSSRALSLWLSSRRDHLVEHWLSRFSFLLHGDQGATLAAWAAMELAPGFGLEISFLINALFRPGMHTGRIVNALTLPHAHLPKDEGDNFAMGVEMFTLVQHLLNGMTSRGPEDPAASAPGPVPQRRWVHQSPTKLGYKPVELTWALPRVPALYPAVTALTAEGGAS
jgi:hypothetical protein